MSKKYNYWPSILITLTIIWFSFCWNKLPGLCDFRGLEQMLCFCPESHQKSSVVCWLCPHYPLCLPMLDSRVHSGIVPALGLLFFTVGCPLFAYIWLKDNIFPKLLHCCLQLMYYFDEFDLHSIISRTEEWAIHVSFLTVSCRFAGSYVYKSD